MQVTAWAMLKGTRRRITAGFHDGDIEELEVVGLDYNKLNDDEQQAATDAAIEEYELQCSANQEEYEDYGDYC